MYSYNNHTIYQQDILQIYKSNSLLCRMSNFTILYCKLFNPFIVVPFRIVTK